jgi:hypothetical protein
MPIRIAGLALVLLLVAAGCGGSTAAHSEPVEVGPAAQPAADPLDTTEETARNEQAIGPWSPKTLDALVDPIVVVDVGFEAGIPADWYKEIWMNPGDDQGEITAGDGVRFTGRGGSTRSGIMTDVGFEVGEYTHLVLEVSGAVIEQGLAGTGWHGREAPLAVLVTYVDAAGTEHVSLGEDPTIPTSMFFRGFTALPEADMVNGVEVVLGETFTHQFDLMELDPAPVTVLGVGVEGAGWDPRVGEVYRLTLAAGF